ncbi:hypothetical protein GQ472_07020 [archaeon]|nr:hypothetical protein [archaeon]
MSNIRDNEKTVITTETFIDLSDMFYLLRNKIIEKDLNPLFKRKTGIAQKDQVVLYTLVPGNHKELENIFNLGLLPGSMRSSDSRHTFRADDIWLENGDITALIYNQEGTTERYDAGLIDTLDYMWTRADREIYHGFSLILIPTTKDIKNIVNRLDYPDDEYAIVKLIFDKDRLNRGIIETSAFVDDKDNRVKYKNELVLEYLPEKGNIFVSPYTKTYPATYDIYSQQHTILLARPEDIAGILIKSKE